MTNIQATDPAGQVQKGIAVDIFDTSAFRPLNVDRG
jgi:hypothetical protein